MHPDSRVVPAVAERVVGRLDLDVRDHKLGTLAAWARIQQQQAHSAVDDVRVLEAIFLKLMTEATRGQVTLPMSANTAEVRQPWGNAHPR